MLAAYSFIAGFVEVFHDQSMFTIRVSLLVVDWGELGPSFLSTSFGAFASSFASSSFQAWCMLDRQGQLSMIGRWEACSWGTWWR